MPAPTGRRVVVTGMGSVTSLGTGVPTFWERLVAGESGIERIASFDPARIHSQVAGEVRDLDASSVLDRKELRRTDRCTQMALVATREAMLDAGLPPVLEGQLAVETGILMATGLGGTATLIDQVLVWSARGPDHLSPFCIPMAIANMPSAVTAIVTGALGPNYSTTSACASSGHSIGDGTETILRGDAEVVLAGGCEAPISEFTMGALCAMRALSGRNDDPAGSSRPFSRDRDGFVLAEGAATLVLEELEHARRRGAPILAEVIGYAATADALHVTRPAPGGSGAVRAGRRAMEKAGIRPDEIDLVSAHATSTPEGDPAELDAIQTLLGAHAPRASITAVKSSVGHAIGAAGAIAAVAAIRSLQTGIVPPTRNLLDPDPAVGDLDCTPIQARRRDLRVALIHTFSFGGQNASLLLRAWPADA